MNIAKGSSGPKVISPSRPFVCVPLVTYKRQARKEIFKNNKNKKTPWEFVLFQKHRSNKVFALLMAFSKCADTPVGSGRAAFTCGK